MGYDLPTISAIVYAKWDEFNKDEIKAFASFVLRNPMMDLSAINDEKVKNAFEGKFATDAEELKFKKSIALVSSLMRGTQEVLPADIILTKSEADKHKKSGTLDFTQLEPRGKAGRYQLYEHKRS